jgi:hypothetical protein
LVLSGVGCDGCSKDEARQAAEERQGAAARAVSAGEKESEELDSGEEESESNRPDVRREVEPDAESQSSELAVEKMWAVRVYRERVRLGFGRRRTPSVEGASFGFEERRAAYDASKIREPLNGLDDIQVLGTDGPVTVRLAQIEKGRYGQSRSDVDYTVLSEESAHLEEPVPDYLLAGPPGTFAESATYREVQAEHIDETAASALAADLSKEVEEDVDLAAGRYHGVRGEFPSPHDMFVMVRGPERMNGVGQRFPVYRAATFASSDGEVTAFVAFSTGSDVEQGHVELSGIEVNGLADVDGDGEEAVFFEYDSRPTLIDVSAAGEFTRVDLEIDD